MRIRLWPVEARLHQIAPYFSTACLAFLALTFGVASAHIHAKNERAAMCLAENIYHEARNQKPNHKYVLGMLTLARVSDPDPQWPKTVCGVVAQSKQFSWTLDHKLATDRSEKAKWEESERIARDLMKHAWKGYRLPAGWECARFYKRTDNKGVSAKSKAFFDKQMFPVGHFGDHSAFQEKRGCKVRLPTV